MAEKKIHLGESFLDRLIKDTYNKNSLGDLSTEQMNELDAYMKSDDFKTKSLNFRSADRTKFEGSVDHFLGKDTAKSKTYLRSKTNPDTTKYLIPRLQPEQPEQSQLQQLPLQQQLPQQQQQPQPQLSLQTVVVGSLSGGTQGDSGQKTLRFNDLVSHANFTSMDTYNGKKYLRYDPDGVGDFYVDADGKIYVIPVGGGLGAELKSRPNWGGEAYDELLKILNQYYKQGGKMNRIKYFQKGGAAQQGAQDMQQQVVALVQAAIQGDEKATLTVNQIMEAAKKGDQQAVQLAQMIQAVVQQMKGQATSAKWGSKLGYIRSLKYAQGGKACPACAKGAPIKVEEKACGGKAKKAKKRYFGGWL